VLQKCPDKRVCITQDVILDEFERYLAELGWSRGDLCTRLGLHRNTPGRWGDSPPKYVMAYLAIAVDMKRAGESLVSGVAPQGGKKC